MKKCGIKSPHDNTIGVKRLFIDKQYKTNCKNPEENEDPKDYTFIFATVEDNTHLLESSPTYLKTLANMPEDLREAYRYGNWDAIGGNYFKEFSEATHSMEPFKIPAHWMIYRSFDYGLDMFACFWYAVDEDGRSWVIREYEHKGLIVQNAAKAAKDNTLPSEHIAVTYAPPDMWSRMKDTGKTMAELFAQNGVPIVKSDNNRVQGHMMIKDMMAPIPLKDPFVRSLFKGKAPDKMPGLMFFNTCKEVMQDLRDIQADEDNPNDCSKQPHEITHTVDGLRYYCISRVLPAELPPDDNPAAEEDDDLEDYEAFMCGGAVSDSYVMYEG